MRKEKIEALTKYQDMMAFKIVNVKDGKRYIDFYICWLYQGKVRDARIRPLFFDGYRCVFSVAKEVSSWQEMKQIAQACLCGC